MTQAPARRILPLIAAALAPRRETASLAYRLGRSMVIATAVFIALGVLVQGVFPLVMAQTQMPPLFDEQPAGRP